MLLFFKIALLAAVGATVTTAAGTGERGYGGDGGPAAEARLNQPFDVACDAAGNLYLSDTYNHRVRRIDRATGRIGTVAGTGAPGYSGDGGPARQARLDEPYGLALDARGNLFLVDKNNRRVRRVDAASGVITTVAGDGSDRTSGDGGPADRAGLAEPNGVAVDPAGRRLLIADVSGHRVRAVDLKTGVISTFAGTGKPRHEGDGGPAAAASLHSPRAVEIGPDGAVYILEREGNTLRAVDPRTGRITTVAGTGAKGYSGDGGPARAATFAEPKELAVDREGNLWIVDTENHAIRRVDARTGRVSTVIGTGRPGGDGDGGPARSARLDRPHGVAVGPDGTVYIGDTENNKVREVIPESP